MFHPSATAAGDNADDADQEEHSADEAVEASRPQKRARRSATDTWMYIQTSHCPSDVVDTLYGIQQCGAMQPKVALVHHPHAYASTLVAQAPLKRTLKVLYAVVRGTDIVLPSWVTAAVSEGGWPSADSEHRHPDAPATSRTSDNTRRTLLSGQQVAIRGVTGPLATHLPRLVRECGGEVRFTT